MPEPKKTVDWAMVKKFILFLLQFLPAEQQQAALSSASQSIESLQSAQSAQSGGETASHDPAECCLAAFTSALCTLNCCADALAAHHNGGGVFSQPKEE
jgi:hypothetical protein